MHMQNSHLKKLIIPSHQNIDVQCATILAESLARNKSLNVLCLSSRKIGDEAATLLGNGLGKDNSLKKLSLSSIGPNTSTGWAALFKGLSNPSSSLNELHMTGNNISDKGALALSGAFSVNNSLKWLDLSVVSNSTNSWIALLKSLFNPDSVLEKLYMYNNDIDDEVVTFLGGALVNNATLKSLSLMYNISITERGWAAFFGRLSNLNSLEDLNVSMNNIDDDGMTVLSNVLGDNSTLRSLAGWQAFFGSVLEELDLSYNTIDDDGIPPLVFALARVSSLSCLHIDNNRLITSVGLMALSTLLQGLEKLRLESVNMNDVTVIGFANALVNNTETKTLQLGYTGSRVTLRGWKALASVLCNKSSIDSIYRSNHTLQDVGWINNRPDDLVSYLELNKNDNKFEVARQKIIQQHFLRGDNINIDEFLDMDVEVLPRAIAWIGRDATGQSLLFKLVQSMPTCFIQI